AKEKAIDSNDPASWMETYRLFEEADAIRSTKESKYELAVAANKMRADDVAYQAYEDSIALGLVGPAREKADAFLAEHVTRVARVTVSGPAGAQVSVGGRRRGTLPLSRPLVVFAGKTVVTVAFQGSSRTKELTTVATQTSTLDFDFTPSTPPTVVAPPVIDRSSTMGWTLVGIGGATLAVGISSFVIAQKSIDARRTSLDSTCTAVRDGDHCPETDPAYVGFAKSDVDAIATWKAVRVGGAITAGVGAVVLGAGILRVVTARSSVSPSVSFGPSGFALSVAARF
ncbi:MAG: hypothetical protein ACXVEE_22190, partial [Polyangiales bacterium]